MTVFEEAPAAARAMSPASVSRPGAPRPVTPMSILASKLDELRRLMDALDGAGPDVRAAIQEACELAGGLDPYLSRCSSAESAALATLAARTAAEDWSRRPGAGSPGQLEQEMLSGHIEGQTLKMLVHAAQAQRVLEIGMFTGYSALAMAEALPADGSLVACEIDADVAAFAQRCFDDSPDGHKIDVRVGPALPTLHALAASGARFDLVFIDADKAGYAEYVSTVLGSGLLAPHGLICVDNTLMQGQPWSGKPTANGLAIAAFNQSIADDPGLDQVIIPLRDGLTLIRRAG